jgi:hypothetical protein
LDKFRTDSKTNKKAGSADLLIAPQQRIAETVFRINFDIAGPGSLEARQDRAFQSSFARRGTPQLSECISGTLLQGTTSHRELRQPPLPCGG